MKTTVASQENKQTVDSAAFLSVMTGHFEKSWDQPAGDVPNEDGSRREATGRQMISYLTAMHGSPEDRVRLVRQQEQALEDAAYLVAAIADPTHGAGSLDVRDTLEDLTEKLNALRLLTPYQREDGSLAI